MRAKLAVAEAAALVDEQFQGRVEAWRTGRVDPRVDNRRLVTTDGRKAALDLRLGTDREHG